MAEFQTFDLGRVFQAGEAINSMRRQARTDALQERYLDQRIRQNDEEMARQKRADEIVLGKEKAQQIAVKSQQILQAADTKGYVEQYEPDLVKNLTANGIDWATLDNDGIKRYVTAMQNRANQELGVAPAAPVTAQEVGGFQTLQQGGKVLATAAPPKPETITPYQQARLDLERQQLNRRTQNAPADTGPLVQVAGPDGNPVYATREEAVGRPAYVARDKPAAADVKWQREIKSKQPRLQAAERRVERLAGAVESISKNKLFDGGPADQYALAWTQQGQEIAQAKASLLSEITALTRVPGIGSQSDLETRLASLPFPSAEFSPEVNRRAVAELKAFMADLKDVYGMAAQEGETVDQAAPERNAAPKAPMRISSDDDYARLPSGATYIAPDGTTRTKR